MRAVTLKLPAALALRLKQTVARRGTTQSKIIRDALEAHLADSSGKGQSCLDLARDLAGSVRGGPADLSSNKRHLKGYGR